MVTRPSSDCRAEYLLAFSCTTRELRPSCPVKRAVVTAELVFCHKVIPLPQGEGRLSEERSRLLLS